MKNKINYKNLKLLSTIDENTINIFEYLKYLINKQTGKDLLYIYETKKEADKKYNKLVESFKYRIKKKDKQNGFIEFANNERIYIWTINEIKNPLDGYRFRDIRIR